jgi:hypothetical protein
VLFADGYNPKMSSMGFFARAGAAEDGWAAAIDSESPEEPKIDASKSWLDCIVAALLPSDTVGMSEPRRSAWARR